MTGRIHYPPLYRGTFLLLMTGVAAVMYAMAQPLQATLYTLFWGGVYGTGLYACRRFGEEHEAQFQQLANLGAGLALALFLGGIALSGVETGLILLLLTLQAGRNLVLASRRDLNFALTLSIVLLLFAAGKAMTAEFIAFMILFTLAGMYTFMADHIDGRLTIAHGGDQDLLTNKMNLPVKGFGLALLTLALAFVIYLVVPRPPSPQLQAFPAKSSWNYDNRRWETEARKPRPEGQGETGNSSDGAGRSRRRELTEAEAGQDVNASVYGGFRNRFDVADIGDRPLPVDTIVLYLQTNNPLYVRGKVFDSFDGRSWEDTGFGAEKRYHRQGQFTFDAKTQPGDVRQVFTVRQDLPPFIFAAYQPRLVAFPGTVIETDDALALRAPDRLHKGTIYTVVSHIEEVDKHPCSGSFLSEDNGRTADNRYLALYPDISERLRTLGRDLTRRETNDLGRAKAVESWLRDNFAYTLDTVGVKWSGNPVEQFLFDRKAGHCELFASSMVIIMRTLDIPARLVTGFHVNRYNPVTGYYEVRLSDGHAWVEAYLEPHGWVTFEPTSSFQLPQRTQRCFVATGLVRYLGDRVEDLIRKDKNSWWAQFIQSAMAALQKLWLAVKLISAWLLLRSILIWDWFIREGWLAILLLLAAVAAGWYIHRLLGPALRLARLRRFVNGDPQEFLWLCYKEMEHHFTLQGLARPQHVTPLEYEQLLVRRFSTLNGQITLITRHFQVAAYGPLAVTRVEAEEALQAFEEIHAWKEQCR